MNLKELGVLHKAGPELNISVQIAVLLRNNMDEINQLADHQGLLMQDTGAETDEWCRLVALVIEAAMERWDGKFDWENKTNVKRRDPMDILLR